jgi:hypothetical protein
MKSCGICCGCVLVAFWLFAFCGGCCDPANAICCRICSGICCGIYGGIYGQLLVAFCLLSGSFLVAFWFFASRSGCCAPTNAVCCCELCGICCGICCGLCCGIFGKLMVVYSCVLVAFWLVSGSLLSAVAFVFLRMLLAVVYYINYVLRPYGCVRRKQQLRPYECLRLKPHLRPSECLSLQQHVRSYECLRLLQHWQACSGANVTVLSLWIENPENAVPFRC